jgi:hypothetical protein
MITRCACFACFWSTGIYLAACLVCRSVHDHYSILGSEEDNVLSEERPSLGGKLSSSFLASLLLFLFLFHVLRMSGKIA